MASIFFLALLLFFFGGKDGEIDWTRLILLMIGLVMVSLLISQTLTGISATIAMVAAVAVGLLFVLGIAPARAVGIAAAFLAISEGLNYLLAG